MQYRKSFFIRLSTTQHRGRYHTKIGQQIFGFLQNCLIEISHKLTVPAQKE
jgi:hypothetical protein